MRYLIIICLCVLLSGCAYISRTVVTMKAKDVSAMTSGIPVGVKDGDVLLERTMEVYVFYDRKKDK